VTNFLAVRSGSMTVKLIQDPRRSGSGFETLVINTKITWGYIYCRTSYQEYYQFSSVVGRHRLDLHFDADLDPDWHQNDADPHAGHNPSFPLVEI
jgi:hypothetical protein